MLNIVIRPNQIIKPWRESCPKGPLTQLMSEIGFASPTLGEGNGIPLQ